MNRSIAGKSGADAGYTLSNLFDSYQSRKKVIYINSTRIIVCFYVVAGKILGNSRQEATRDQEANAKPDSLRTFSVLEQSIWHIEKNLLQLTIFAAASIV